MSEHRVLPTEHPIVHIVEDDRPVREATARFLTVTGFVVKTYRSADEFLATAPVDAPGCVILDLRLPGASGLDLQQELVKASHDLPVVFMSGQGQIPDSVRAMKSGAIDFLTKPVEGQVLLEAVTRALARDAANRASRAHRSTLRERYERLTPREREVFAHLISGQLNKQVGFDLGISERTVKIHRHQVLQKMQADSIADLVRIASDLEIASAGRVR